MNDMSSPYYLSRVMQHVLEKARRVAESDSIVLLLGESGSGKDHLARYIHDYSRRSLGPFFSLNCAAIPPELAESELFGYEKGAFTGACETKIGLIELAKNGTLVLNEIGDIPLSLQAKLLAVLETKAFLRVGGRKQVHVNARIIAATNRNLAQMVSDGRFRADLYYRLNVFPIVVPPLRSRKEDIPVLAGCLLTVLAVELGLTRVPTLEPAALERLFAYDWPGNVRELRNVLERALTCSGGGTTIVADSLGVTACVRDDLIPPPLPALSEKRISGTIVDGPRSRGLSLHASVARGILGNDEQFERMMRELFRGKPTPVAAIAVALGCSRKTVSNRISRLGLAPGYAGRMKTGSKQKMIDQVQQWIKDNPIG